MRMTYLLMVVALAAGLVACGGAPQEDAAAPEKAQVVEPTPVFQDDFEGGQAEGWTEGDEAQVEDEGSEAAPAE